MEKSKFQYKEAAKKEDISAKGLRISQLTLHPPNQQGGCSEPHSLGNEITQQRVHHKPAIPIYDSSQARFHQRDGTEYPR
jgi:hypothetical protein